MAWLVGGHRQQIRRPASVRFGIWLFEVCSIAPLAKWIMMKRVARWTPNSGHVRIVNTSSEVAFHFFRRISVWAGRTFVVMGQAFCLLLISTAAGCKSTHPIDTITAEDVRELEEYRELHPEIAAKTNERSMLTSLKRSASQRNQPIRSFSDRPC